MSKLDSILKEAYDLADYITDGPMHQQPTLDRCATLLRQLCMAIETRNAALANFNKLATTIKVEHIPKGWILARARAAVLLEET